MKYAILGLALGASLISRESNAILMEGFNGEILVIPSNGCYGSIEWKLKTTADTYLLTREDIHHGGSTPQGILEVVVGRLFETGRINADVDPAEVRENILFLNPDFYQRDFQPDSRVGYELTEWESYCPPDRKSRPSGSLW